MVLHAAAMTLALLAISMLIGAGAGVLPAVLMALACVVLAARLGGVSAVFARAPRDSVAAVTGLGEVFRGAFKTARAAVAADVTVWPALVRIKSASPQAELAAAAHKASAAPGALVVAADSDGLLVHVLDENDDAARERLETRFRGGRTQ